MGIHDGPELNRPYFEFTIDPDREPFPLSRYKVSDETYVSFEIWSDGSVRTSDAGSAVAAGGSAITSLTDNSGGTASNTIPAQTGAYVEATQETTVASLAGKVNEIIAALRAAKIIPT